MSLLPCYVVQNNSFVGPYVAKITSVNVNYGVYSLILDTDQKVQLTGNKVYFTKFFAQREVRRLEKKVAAQLAIADTFRYDNESEEL